MPYDVCAYNLEILIAKLAEAKQTFSTNPRKAKAQALPACIDFLAKTFPELGHTDLLRPLTGIADDLVAQQHGGTFHTGKDREKGVVLHAVRHLRKECQLSLREAAEHVCRAFRRHKINNWTEAAIRSLVHEVDKTSSRASRMPEDVCAQYDEEMRRDPPPRESSAEERVTYIIGAWMQSHLRN